MKALAKNGEPIKINLKITFCPKLKPSVLYHKSPTFNEGANQVST